MVPWREVPKEPEAGEGTDARKGGGRGNSNVAAGAMSVSELLIDRGWRLRGGSLLIPPTPPSLRYGAVPSPISAAALLLMGDHSFAMAGRAG